MSHRDWDIPEPSEGSSPVPALRAALAERDKEIERLRLYLDRERELRRLDAKRIAELEAAIAAAEHYGGTGLAVELVQRDKRIAELEERETLAGNLFHRVRIKDGAGTWTAAERDAWASDFKDYRNSAAAIALNHRESLLTNERDAANRRISELERQLFEAEAKAAACDVGKIDELRQRIKELEEEKRIIESGANERMVAFTRRLGELREKLNKKESRSVQRRKAAQEGRPSPKFD